MIMGEELLFKVEELLCKQDVGDVEKLKLFAATLGIDGEQFKSSKDRTGLKYIIIKVSEGKLDEEGKTDEEKCDIFKHMIEDLKLNHEIAQVDQKEDGKKMLFVLITMLIMMFKVITLYPSYVS